jgi:hypothetical protein
LGIRFPEPHCDYSKTRAHHYEKLVGNIWRCKHCWTPVWFPGSIDVAYSFSESIDKLGLDAAYRKFVSARPKTEVLLAKLEDIRLLRKVLSDEDFLGAVAAIISDSDFSVAYDEDSKVPPKASSRAAVPYKNIYGSSLQEECR